LADEFREVQASAARTPQGAVSREQVTTTSADQRVSKAQAIVYTLLGILEALLVIRFFLALFGANPYNGFAQFIYAITYPFIAPFATLFNEPTTSLAGRIEIDTIVAIIIYAIVGWIILRLLELGKKQPQA
jgi:hypothetical protein